MSTLAANLSEALHERVPDLANANNAAEVETIVGQAELEARRRSEIPDTFVYRATVIVLGVSVVTVVIAQFTLALRGQASIPDGLIAIGAAAIGALAGLLAPTPAK
jgi:hypothetical protein